MMRTLAVRRPSPAMLVALVALVFACAGSATAASVITGKQIKNNSVTGSDVKNKSLGVGDLSVKARKSLAGVAGPAGAAGPAGPAGPAGAKGDTGAPGLSGLEMVSAESASNTSPKSAVAACPEGKRVVGSGGAISLIGSADIAGINPNPGLTQVTVAASNADGNANAWSVTARAICATVG